MTPHSNYLRSRCLPAVLVGALVGLILVAANVRSVRAAENEAPWGRIDFQPYRVGVLVKFATDPSISVAFKDDFLKALRGRIALCFSPAWTLDGTSAVRFEDRLATDSEGRLAEAQALAGFSIDPGWDKCYWIAVRLRGSEWLLTAREWDKTLQTLGPIREARALDRKTLADVATALLEQVFSPLLAIDDADKDSKITTLKLRAGSLPFGDSSFLPLAKGDVLVAYFRFVNSKHQVRKIQAVPWTYLVVDEIADGRVKCTSVSSFRAPLAANMRRRVEAYAIRVRQYLAESRIRLVVARSSGRPMAGVFVSTRPWEAAQPAKSAPKSEPKSDSKSEAKDAVNNGLSARLLSDRDGIVSIPAAPPNRVLTIEVHSGTAILARRPFLPGIEPEIVLELADDSLRLAAEREIDLLRGKLIETVARRAWFIARARSLAKVDHTSEAGEMVKQIERLPSASDYESELNKIRVVALDEAEKRRDKLAARRINDLCQKTTELIQQYLPEAKLQAIKEELAVQEGEKPDFGSSSANKAAAKAGKPGPGQKPIAKKKSPSAATRPPGQKSPNSSAAPSTHPTNPKPAVEGN